MKTQLVLTMQEVTTILRQQLPYLSAEYLDLLDGKISNPIPGQVGARIVAVCEAALASIRTKRPQVPHWF